MRPFTALFLLYVCCLPAQQQTTIRTTTREVLVDFIVRDKRGRMVRDLKPEDVAVFENGAPQKTKSFRLVRVVDRTEREVQPLRGDTSAVPAPEPGAGTAASRQAQDLRAVSIVFDRISSPGARQLAIQAARALIDSEASSSTHIGLFVLGARMYVFQPYTADRDLLRKKLEQIATAGDGLFQSVSEQIQLQIRNAIGRGGQSGSGLGGGQHQDDQPAGAAAMSRAIRNSGMREETTEGSTFSLPGTAEIAGSQPFLQMYAKLFDYEERALPGALDRMNLLSLLALIREQGGLPGRKSMLLISEGMKVPLALQYVLDTAASEANRANVTLYTLDARGLSPQGMTFEGRSDLAAATASSASIIFNVYANDFRIFERAEAAVSSSSQEPMRELAESTGGFFIGNTNDVRAPVHRMVEEIGTQYELTYSPADPVYDGRFRRIELRVRRPGVTVQARKGYYAVPSMPGQTLFPFELALLNAVSAPEKPHAFDFHVGLVQFRPGETLTEAVVAFELPRQALTLSEDPEAKAYRTRAAFLALIKDGAGRVIEKVSRDVHLRVPLDRRDAFERGNLIFVHPLRLPPGGYRIEAAVLDGEARRASVRSAEANLAQASGLALSDVVLARQVEGLDRQADPTDPLEFEDKAVTPAVSNVFRRRANTELSVFCVLYPDAGVKEPLDVKIEFLKDGQPASRLAGLVSLNERGPVPYLARFRTSDFAPGRYEAVVTVQAGGASASRKTSFTIEP